MNESRPPSPDAVQQLTAFAATTLSGSQVPAAAVPCAIAAVHSKEALPFLASLRKWRRYQRARAGLWNIRLRQRMSNANEFKRIFVSFSPV